MDTLSSSSGDENKIYFVLILGCCIVILILLLLLSFGMLTVGGGSAQGDSSTGGSCSDNNPCTTDSYDEAGNCVHSLDDGPTLTCSGPAGLCQVRTCAAGSCIMETILDCCGNALCEENETVGNCPMDCGSLGGVTINTDSDGNTYNEFDSGGEATCDSDASSSSSGSLCICFENDCDDGLDNDNDGQVDCDDPDCPCPDCPECENDGLECASLDYPCCELGACPSGKKCDVVDRVNCECVDDSSTSCEDSLEMKCTGDCPPDEICEFVPGGVSASGVVSNPTCECAGDSTTNEDQCEDLDPLTSQTACRLGACPPNQRCDYVSGGIDVTGAPLPASCECVDEQVTCEDSYQYQCTGDCPKDQRCVITSWDECQCIDIQCEDTDVPACNGDCPKDEKCEVVDNSCECVAPEQNCDDRIDNDGDGLIDCMDPECCPPDYDEDGGSCCCEDFFKDPEWESCWPDCDECICPNPSEECINGAQSCQCDIPQQAIPCDQSQTPTCGGDCPQGYSCGEFILMSGASSCICLTNQP